MSNHYKMSQRPARTPSRMSERASHLVSVTVIVLVGVIAFATGNDGFTVASSKSEPHPTGQRVIPVSIVPIVESGIAP